MKKRELASIGITEKNLVILAQHCCNRLSEQGVKKLSVRNRLQKLVESPTEWLEDEVLGELAAKLLGTPDEGYTIQKDLTYSCFGEEIDVVAHEQMENACSLPVSVAAALMPDAHVGYGLPIGGVLATDNAVIPYAVGVDIACRVRVSVFGDTVSLLQDRTESFKRAIADETRFGIGAKFKDRRDHGVLDRDWRITPITGSLKDLAWSQLGTSGSGNHFVEFGVLTLTEDFQSLVPGEYLALVSHSGSRGPGANVARYYSDLARSLHPNLPTKQKHLAWLDMDSHGAEYWAAMELMGEYAKANHELIHSSLTTHLGLEIVGSLENHHNFAWKEQHENRPVIVHRKGATPAQRGEFGYIPGTMIDPGYIVRGLGNESSLNSSAHGAGRKMSRKKAKNTTNQHHLNQVLKDARVELISAGLDESPHAYKDIDSVMQAQKNLVTTIGKFEPKLVKMAPAGSPPED